MPLSAILESGEKVYAKDVRDRSLNYRCKLCGEQMVLVLPKTKIDNYFRHKVSCDLQWEPESEKHEQGKQAVYDLIKSIGYDLLDTEYQIDELYADVYWEFNDRKIAFEIQQQRYTLEKFCNKFEVYEKNGLITIYLLIGSDFGKEVTPKSNIYGLTELEKEFFLNSSEWRNESFSASGGYLRKTPDGESLIVNFPIYQTKLRKGNEGICTHRFRKIEDNKVLLKDVLLRLVSEPYREVLGSVYHKGVIYRNKNEARFGVFLNSLGWNYTYRSETFNERLEVGFVIKGRLPLFVQVPDATGLVYPFKAGDIDKHHPEIVGRYGVICVDPEDKLSCQKSKFSYGAPFSLGRLDIPYESGERTSCVEDEVLVGRHEGRFALGHANQDYSDQISGEHPGGCPFTDGAEVREKWAEACKLFPIDTDSRLSCLYSV